MIVLPRRIPAQFTRPFSNYLSLISRSPERNVHKSEA
jgi:hypothetical protein